MIQLPPVFTNEQWHGESVIQSSHLITGINNKWATVQEARKDLLSCSRYLSARLTSLLPRAIEGCDRRMANDVPQKPENKFLLPQAGRKGITKKQYWTRWFKKGTTEVCVVSELWMDAPQPTEFQCLNFPPTDGWTSWLSAERSLCLSSSCVSVCARTRRRNQNILFLRRRWHWAGDLLTEKGKKRKQMVTLPRHEKWIWPQKFGGLAGSSERAGVSGGGSGQREEQ